MIVGDVGLRRGAAEGGEIGVELGDTGRGELQDVLGGLVWRS
jgi:hypothetical protein